MSQLINGGVAKLLPVSGVADLYVQTGRLNVTKNSGMSLIKLRPGPKILKSAQKIHQNIMQNIDSKFTLGIDST